MEDRFAGVVSRLSWDGHISAVALRDAAGVGAVEIVCAVLLQDFVGKLFELWLFCNYTPEHETASMQHDGFRIQISSVAAGDK